MCLLVKDALHVKYTWTSNPISNLYDEADLLAPLFRTDDLKYPKLGKK